MNLIKPLLLLSLLFIAAIFGFFYAWICSTMWGLDQMAPASAIEAMNAMNRSVRNPVFFPAFFLTPLVLAITAGACWRRGIRKAAGWIAAASVVYFTGALIPTALVNVPMNEALMLVDPTNPSIDAAQIWTDYSSRWQIWNTARTVASGVALLAFGWGAISAGDQARQAHS